MIEVRIFDNGEETLKLFKEEEVLIGRASSCNLCLLNTSISRNHARIFIREGKLFFEDLGSANGSIVNNLCCRKGVPVEIDNNKEIYLGEVKIAISLPDNERIISDKKNLSGDKDRNGMTVEKQVFKEKEEKVSTQKKVVEEESKEKNQAKREIKVLKERAHKLLLEKLNLKTLDFSKTSDEEIRKKVSESLADIIQFLSSQLPRSISREALKKELINEALGLGPLEELLTDPDVTEIMVNGYENIYIEKKGKITLTDYEFTNNEYLLNSIERIVHRIGRRIDESSPLVDARLPDGSRVNAVIIPISLIGPCLTIRRFPSDPFTPDDLVKFGSVSSQMLEFLRFCIVGRQDIVVAGGTGTGKTTILNVLSSFLPADERIVTIEDSAELKLTQQHVVRMEARPANIEGKGAISIRDLVRNSLRMRPDRIVVGECRGGEALDMLQAMNTGHDGSLTTVHANSPRETLSRLEIMTLMSGMDLPLRAIREQIASAVDVIVFLSRLADGSRKITHITEITGMENDVITSQDIFSFKQTGVDDNGKVRGEYVPTGNVPTFLNDLKTKGLAVNMAIFNPGGN